MTRNLNAKQSTPEEPLNAGPIPSVYAIKSASNPSRYLQTFGPNTGIIINTVPPSRPQLARWEIKRIPDCSQETYSIECIGIHGYYAHAEPVNGAAIYATLEPTAWIMERVKGNTWIIRHSEVNQVWLAHGNTGVHIFDEHGIEDEWWILEDLLK